MTAGIAGSIGHWNSSVDLMKNGGWIDDQTRAIIVSMVFYTPSVNYYTQAHILFEMSISGYVTPSTITKGLEMDMYATDQAKVVGFFR